MRAGGAWGSILLALLLVAPASAEEPAPERVALVVSGGVSLGSYQAGATYATLRHLLLLRDHESRAALQRRLARALEPEEHACIPLLAPAELEVSTGASAGNINAWLAGMTWCEAEPDRVTPRSTASTFLSLLMTTMW